MPDSTPADLLIAQQYELPAARLRPLYTSTIDRSFYAQSELKLIRIVLTMPLLDQLGVELSRPVELTLAVDGRWFNYPDPRTRGRSHHVSTAPVVRDEFQAEFCGHVASIEIERALPTSYDLRRQGIIVQEPDDLDDYIIAQDDDRGPGHWVLGYARPIQNDVWDALRYDLEASGQHDELIRLNTMEHRLLFQVDSDRQLGLSIADCGRIYVLVPLTDLHEGRFDRTAMVMQSC